jgi:hypothetical protein
LKGIDLLFVTPALGGNWSPVYHHSYYGEGVTLYFSLVQTQVDRRVDRRGLRRSVVIAGASAEGASAASLGASTADIPAAASAWLPP